MKKLLSVFVMIFSAVSYSQGHSSTQIGSVLDNADSVFLLRHTPTGAVVLRDANNKQINKPLVTNNKLNDHIIQKKVNLKRDEIADLKRILLEENQDKKIEIANCNIPEHAILIKKNSKYSFVDLSFDCNQVSSSRDLNIRTDDFSKDKWRKLQKLFEQKGLFK